MLTAMHARAQDAAVRIEYRAADGCPDQAAFFEELGSRMRRARFAAPDEIARTVRVTIVAEDQSRYRARVEFTDVDGRKVSREVQGENCEEAADGIALITALAIDARAKASESESPAPQPKSGSRPALEPHSAAPAPSEPVRAEPASLPHADVGIGLFVTSAAAPELLLGISGFVGAGFDRAGPSFRLTVMHALSRRVELGAEHAKFQLTFGRAEACPLSFVISERLETEPCAAIDVGRLVGEGVDSPVITEPETAEVFWLCPSALGRLRFILGDFLLLELSAELGVPLYQEEFLLNGREVYVVPAVRFGGAFSVGYRFQ